jgi:hypothetical protein
VINGDYFVTGSWREGLTDPPLKVGDTSLRVLSQVLDFNYIIRISGQVTKVRKSGRALLNKQAERKSTLGTHGCTTRDTLSCLDIWSA